MSPPTITKARRWSKYDPHVLYNPRTNQVALFEWDVSWNGVSEWWVCTGNKCWWIKGKQRYPKGFVLVTRVPEGMV